MKRSDRKKKISKKAKPKRKPRRRVNWASWPDEKLLDLRLCDLRVRWQKTWLERPIARLHQELEKRDLRLRPHFWLSEEWFSPDGMPGIAIPFYLAHPRLIRLERSQMLEVEGGSHEWCMKILRHETGHAFCHAFGLHRRKRWQALFGHATKRYPDTYRPRPASKRFVLHLSYFYAQSHPDEDFAETFAVWLKPRPLWRRRYRGWHALKKLEYIDELADELAGRRPRVISRKVIDPLSSIKKTLREYYAEKRARYGDHYPDVYDRDLSALFSSGSRHKHREAASAFLRRNRREIRRIVSKWTGEYQYTLDQVLDDMIGRCRELKLRASGNERQLKLDFAILLTARTVHYLYTNRDCHAL